MKKLGIILDSFAGMNKKQIEDLGFHLVSLKLIVDKKEFLEGSEAYSMQNSPEEWIDFIKDKKDVKSSQPSMNDLTQTFMETSKKYENVIYLPLGVALSGTFQTSTIIAKDFPNVHVVKNNFVGAHSYTDVAKKLINLAEEGKQIDEIINYVTDYTKQSFSYVVPKNMDSLIKGGRFGNSIKHIINKLNIVPIIKYDDELTQKGLRKSGKKAMKHAVSKLINHIGGEDKVNDWWFAINHTNMEKTKDIAINELKEYNIKDYVVELVAPIIVVHTGYGSLSINARPKIKR